MKKGLIRCANFFPQSLNMNINRSFITIKFITPYMFKQLFSRKYLFWMLEQNNKGDQILLGLNW